ncbi:putative isomerase [Oscillibacter valericigenes Sjm18-20]|nr:putative isomerase [Oscillibacter valericigenes Sjm18-20]
MSLNASKFLKFMFLKFCLQFRGISIIIKERVFAEFSAPSLKILRGLKLMSANDMNPRTAREAQQQKEARRSNIMYGTIGVLFVLLAVAVFVWKSNIIQKHATAATLYYSAETTSADGSSSASSSSSAAGSSSASSSSAGSTAEKTKLTDVSVPQVSYYFTNIYQNFIQQNSSYISYLGLDTSKDLRSQSYPSDESKTWFDYFMDQTLSQMSYIYALNKQAEDEGYAWNDAMQTQFDSNMDTLNSNASAADLSLNRYLQRIYGVTMSRSVYEAEMKRVILASDFSQSHSDSLTYTDDQLETEYDANRNNYDVVDYKSVKIDGSAESTTDADGNTVDPTDEEKAAALSAAKSAADSMYASFQNGQSLSVLADANDKATFTDGKAGSYSSSVLMDWLFDSARQGGDSAVLADEDNSAYYVVSFGQRYRQEYSTVDVRHILIQPETGKLKEGDDGYDDEQAQLKADAKAKAEDLLAQWKAGDATEDSFATLANENSSDGGSNTNGGLYKQVYQGQMVTTFNDWCFDSSRKSGDTGIVETDYGYHVMYFVGTDLPYWQVKVTSTLRNNDFSAWYSSVTAGYTGEIADGAKYVG